MIIKKLKNHKSAQAHVMEHEEKLYLISYTTAVLIIDHATNVMEVTGLYSATTRRHISWFLDEYFYYIDYDMVKNAYEQGKKINVITGDLV